MWNESTGTAETYGGGWCPFSFRLSKAFKGGGDYWSKTKHNQYYGFKRIVVRQNCNNKEVSNGNNGRQRSERARD